MAEEKKELLAEKLARERAKKKDDSALNTRTEEFAQNTSDNYVSPFDEADEEYKESFEEEDEEEEISAEEAYMLENRTKTYLIVLAIAYLAFLGLGYYMTNVSGTTPQILTIDTRGQQVYMERADEYIITGQNLYAEIIDVLTKYENKTVGGKEAGTHLQKISEKLQKTKTEVHDLVPPQALESFHSRLEEMLSATLTLSNNSESYVMNRKEDSAQSVRNAQEKYTEISTLVTSEYDAFYKK